MYKSETVKGYFFSSRCGRYVQLDGPHKNSVPFGLPAGSVFTLVPSALYVVYMDSWVISYSDVYSFRIGKDLGRRLYSCRSFKGTRDFVKLLIPYGTNVCDLILFYFKLHATWKKVLESSYTIKKLNPTV